MNDSRENPHLLVSSLFVALPYILLVPPSDPVSDIVAPRPAPSSIRIMR
jgi:hypothetical protein